jgi:hypothetical protein
MKSTVKIIGYVLIAASSAVTTLIAAWCWQERDTCLDSVSSSGSMLALSRFFEGLYPILFFYILILSFGIFCIYQTRLLGLLAFACLMSWWSLPQDPHKPRVQVGAQLMSFRDFEFGHNGYEDHGDDGQLTLSGDSYRCGLIVFFVMKYQ